MDEAPVAATPERACRETNTSTLKLYASLPDPEIRRAVAANEYTPRGVLDDLAWAPPHPGSDESENDMRVPLAVAQNPSTLTTTLVRILCTHMPGSAPAQAASAQLDGRQAISGLRGDPSTWVRLAVAAAESATPATLTLLAGDADWEVRHAVAANTATPPDMLARLACGDSDSAVRRQAARHASLPTEALAELIADADPPALFKLLTHPNVDGAALGAVSRNRYTPVPAERLHGGLAEILTALSESDFETVRVCVARHPDAPVETLRRLSEDPATEVRAAVGHNRSCPAGVLNDLAEDPGHWVAESVAANPATTGDTLRLLADHVSYDVIRFVAANPSCPPELFATMVASRRRFVRQAACTNPAVPAVLLDALASCPDLEIQRDVALNRACPAAALRSLAAHPDPVVRLNAAGNPALPDDALDLLCVDGADDVRGYAEHQRLRRGAPGTPDRPTAGVGF